MEVFAQLLDRGSVKHGVRVIDSNLITNQAFSTLVENALELMAAFDPVRFSRAVREIRAIVNAPAPGGSTFGRPLRMCSVDLRCFYFPTNPSFADAFLASVIIREATYANLISRGVLRNRRNRKRFDNAGTREAQRFCRLLGMLSTPWDSEFMFQASRNSFAGAMGEAGKFVLASQSERNVWSWVRPHGGKYIPGAKAIDFSEGTKT